MLKTKRTLGYIVMNDWKYFKIYSKMKQKERKSKC